MTAQRIGAGIGSSLTAKGDIQTYTTTPARLAVGADGQTLVADSSTSTGLRYQGNFTAGKNKIINGDFGIWQRGTSFATSNVYTSDRWLWLLPGTGTGTTAQQTFTPGTAPVAGYEGTYFLRQTCSVLGSSSYFQLLQRIEDVRTFAGQTVTISFWAKTNSGTISGTYVRLNQNFGSGGSTAVTGASNTYSITSSWARYSATVTLASISGKTIGTGSCLEVEFISPFTTTCAIDFWGVQLEAGSVATNFQTATGTIQQELAACQRYYMRFGTTYYNYGQAQSTSVVDTNVFFPVQMRTAPSTTIENSGLTMFRTANGTVYSSGTWTCTAAGVNTAVLRYTHGSAVFTTAEMCLLLSNSGYVAWSAEL